MKSDKDKRINRTEAAKLLGISVVAFDKKRTRHGIRKGRDGKFSLAEVQAAVVAGVESDKNRLKTMIEGKAGLGEQRLLKQIEKLDVEIKQKQADLDVTLGRLVDIDDVVSRFSAMLGSIAANINVWRESTMAKHPHLRREVEAVSASLLSLISESDTE